MTTKCIFISHSAKEQETTDFLKLLYVELTEESFDVLVDRERLNFGDDWKYEIFNWMGACHCAIILLSKNAIKNSMWVNREVNILLWRRALDPNFILIPICFDVTNEEVKQNELLKGLDLGKYQGLHNKSKEKLIELLKKEIVEQIGKERITTPLDEVAKLIARRLEGLSTQEKKRNEIIKEILDKYRVEIVTWLPYMDPCFVLATTMLNLGLSGSADILDRYGDNLDSRDLKSVFNLIAPSWVDPLVANSISKCALQDEHKTVVVFNSVDRFSIDMYIRRASNRLPEEWLLCYPLIKHGSAPLPEIVTEINNLLIGKLVTDEYDMTEEEKLQALTDALKGRNKQKKPVFIALRYSKTIVELLPKLQKTFPFVTFILLNEKNYHEEKELKDLEGLCFKYLKPPLEPKVEKQAKSEYNSVFGLLKPKFSR